jgi:hypothetical protein
MAASTPFSALALENQRISSGLHAQFKKAIIPAASRHCLWRSSLRTGKCGFVNLLATPSTKYHPHYILLSEVICKTMLDIR